MDDLMRLHWLDSAILVILAAGLLLGARAGIKLLVGVATCLLSGGAAFFGAGPAASLLADRGVLLASGIPLSLSFGALFLAAYLTLLLLTRLARRVVRSAVLGRDDRHVEAAARSLGLQGLGALLGAGVGVVLAGLVLGLILLGLGSTADPQVEAALEGSTLAPRISLALDDVLAAIPQHSKDRLLTAIERLAEEGKTFFAEMAEKKAEDVSTRLDALSAQMQKTREGQQ